MLFREELLRSGQKPTRCNIIKYEEYCPECGAFACRANKTLDDGALECECGIVYHYCNDIGKNIAGPAHIYSE